MKPLLVGEANPYGADPDMALYPLPENASGGRLARILGLSRTEYLRRFDRRNLCPTSWSMPTARAEASVIAAVRAGPIILLGAKVAKAFGFDFVRFGRWGRVYLLPHPSGLNRIWGQPDAVTRARELLADVLAERAA